MTNPTVQYIWLRESAKQVVLADDYLPVPDAVVMATVRGGWSCLTQELLSAARREGFQVEIHRREPNGARTISPFQLN